MRARIESRIGEMLARLREANGRVTPQRVAILRAMVGGHRNAEEIYNEVHRVSPTTSRGTVYKTLETLKALGEIQELEVGVGRAHYDALRPEPHPHVVCTRCGAIEDVEIPGFDSLAGHVERLGHRVESLRLEFFTLCPTCVGPTPCVRENRS